MGKGRAALASVRRVVQLVHEMHDAPRSMHYLNSLSEVRKTFQIPHTAGIPTHSHAMISSIEDEPLLASVGVPALLGSVMAQPSTGMVGRPVANPFVRSASSRSGT